VSDANDTARIRPFKNSKNRLFWAEFPQKIWVNYGIGWSEASDANLLLVGAKRVSRTTLQRSGLQKYKKLRVTCYDRFEAVEAARRRACLLGRISTKNMGELWNWLEQSSDANLLLVKVERAKERSGLQKYKKLLLRLLRPRGAAPVY
jgi:hypothetical protein